MLSALLLKAQRKVSALGFASTLHSISTCSPLATPNTRFCSDLQIGLSVQRKKYMKVFRPPNIRVIIYKRRTIPLLVLQANGLVKV